MFLTGASCDPRAEQSWACAGAGSPHCSGSGGEGCDDPPRPPVRLWGSPLPAIVPVPPPSFPAPLSRRPPPSPARGRGRNPPVPGESSGRAAPGREVLLPRRLMETMKGDVLEGKLRDWFGALAGERRLPRLPGFLSLFRFSWQILCGWAGP